MPASDGRDDVVRIGTPDEWLRLLIMLTDEAVDGSLKVDERMEDAVFQAPPRQLGEEALDPWTALSVGISAAMALRKRMNS